MPPSSSQVAVEWQSSGSRVAVERQSSGSQVVNVQVECVKLGFEYVGTAQRGGLGSSIPFVPKHPLIAYCQSSDSPVVTLLSLGCHSVTLTQRGSMVIIHPLCHK